ncbi:MAG TPA: PilZ domain-containing protein [Nitrospirae bacterium]|nr:PilZ domain protein [bacterium BMS3Abin10]GBE39231.1 PilZ domain protein [bacterium BMS3Bbin08]HDH01366.1 PilZ domain-containing protein [Nitrospirota bacterium]HDH50111.1 PilZ domain-containing protein [Nitrospirota bacterium]HDK81623.1 PilZ domain-containing protein [Nitrospirota bacterium]
MKIPSNRRKSGRFQVPLDMEFVSITGAARYYLGKTINFSRCGLSFVANSIDRKIDGLIMIKFKLLQDYSYVYALADIRWKKKIADKYLVGVKIKKIDQESRDKKLDFPFKIWELNSCDN